MASSVQADRTATQRAYIGAATRFSDVASRQQQSNQAQATGTKRKRIEDIIENQELPFREAKKIKLKECIICISDVSVKRFPNIIHYSSHQHDSSVCLDCFRQHISSRVQEDPWDSIRCPECNENLHEPEIKRIASEKTYQQWLDKAAKACQEIDEEYCSCPSAKCNWGCFISTKEDGNIFTCQMCRCKYCIMCKVPMHGGETCKHYQHRSRKHKKEEKASTKKVKAISKPCPKCKSGLDKYTGCDHVTCLRCRHTFCWSCFAPYGGSNGISRVGNTAHEKTCKYHTGDINHEYDPHGRNRPAIQDDEDGDDD